MLAKVPLVILECNHMKKLDCKEGGRKGLGTAHLGETPHESTNQGGRRPTVKGGGWRGKPPSRKMHGTRSAESSRARFKPCSQRICTLPLAVLVPVLLVAIAAVVVVVAVVTDAVLAVLVAVAVVAVAGVAVVAAVTVAAVVVVVVVLPCWWWCER